MKRTRTILTAVSLLLLCAVTVNLAGCSAPVQAADLMNGITAAELSGKPANEAFLASQTRWSLDLFQAAVSQQPEQSVLISPLSVQLALAMTANGAKGQTRAELERLLGGDIPLEALNDYLLAYVDALCASGCEKLTVSNSIWFRDDDKQLRVKPDFLQTNADYYGAQAYKAAFDGQTLTDINDWVKTHTDGKIEQILDDIDPAAMLYLINALTFDAQWECVYTKQAVKDGTFTALSGEQHPAKMMYSTEALYLEDEKAIGFIKPYLGGRYSFAALLPNEGVALGDYIAGLTANGLRHTLQTASKEAVDAVMPKFESTYEWNMQQALCALGAPTAFDCTAADFSGIADTADRLYIDNVLHKTVLKVNESGTEAAAATITTLRATSAFPFDSKEVILDRPFVYMIVDNSTRLPIFLGTLTDI